MERRQQMSDAPHIADLGTRYRYRQEGAEAERERILTILNQLDSQWRIRLDQLFQAGDTYQTAKQIARLGDYIMAVAAFRNAITDPQALIKGETE